MREPWDWEEQDLVWLVNGAVQESQQLDYKGSGALSPFKSEKRRELAKDVSAFANSAGGILVYGIKEANQIPQEIDEGVDPTEVTRETLEQVIMSMVQPRINDLRIKQISLKVTRPGRVVYVVHVQQSARAPHMAADNRYYRRYEFQNVPMQDYEVRDVMRRYSAPDLTARIRFAFQRAEIPFNSSSEEFPVPIEVFVENSSPQPAFHASVRVRITPCSSVIGPQPESYITSDVQLIEGQPTALVRRIYSSPTEVPLLEGEEVFVFGFKFTMYTGHPESKTSIEWQIRSPGMPTSTGAYVVGIAPGYKLTLNCVNPVR